MWDKKTRSNAYEITDLIKTEKPTHYPSQLPVLNEDEEDHSNLNLLKYSGDENGSGQKNKKKINRPPPAFPRKFRSSGRKCSEDNEIEGEDGSVSPNGRLQVEANVHDSSNEDNDFTIEMDDVPPRFDQTDRDNGPSRFNHHGSDLLRNATTATESEV